MTARAVASLHVDALIEHEAIEPGIETRAPFEACEARIRLEEPLLHGVACVVFGGVVTEPLAEVETVALSGDPARATEDLVELGLRLGTRLADASADGPRR